MTTMRCFGLTLVVFLVGASCGSDSKVPAYPTSVSSSWSLVGRPTSTPEYLYDPGDILLLSDTHVSNPLNPHATLSGGALSDRKASKTAIRPPQLEAWGWKLLDWVLARESARAPQAPIVHLGDAVNMPCKVEFDAFGAIMNYRFKGRWLMAPGNHDSAPYGNWLEYSGEDNKAGKWSGECANYLSRNKSEHDWPGGEKGQSLDKASFLRAYLKLQSWPDVVAQGPRDDDENDCLDIKPTGSIATRVRACIHNDDASGNRSAYTSYILQEMIVPGSDGNVRIILIDATQYRVFPPRNGIWFYFRKLIEWVGILPAPQTIGQIGGLRETQLDVLREWLREDHKNGRKVILGAHYPLDSLDNESKSALKVLIKEFDVMAYLSGHTHDPTNLRKHFGSDGTTTFAELNVGSILDWPMRYQRVSVRTLTRSYVLNLNVIDIPSTLDARATPAVPGVKQERSVSPVPLGTFPAPPGCNSHDQLAVTDAAHYLKYVPAKCKGWTSCKAKGLGISFMKARAAMYDAMKPRVSNAPSEDELTYFSQVDQLYGSTPPAGKSAGYKVLTTTPDVLEYELCQMRWASETESKTDSGAGADAPLVTTPLDPGRWQIEISN